MLSEIVSNSDYTYSNLLGNHSAAWIYLIHKHIVNSRYDELKLAEILRRIKTEDLEKFNARKPSGKALMDYIGTKDFDVRVLEKQGIGYSKKKKKKDK